MTLFTQADEVANYLEAAVRELDNERAEGDKLHFEDKNYTVTGKTPEERRSSAVDAYVREVFELIASPHDGSDAFGAVDRSELLRLLEDSLSPHTRAARRYLLVAASLVFLMGATRQMPAKVPGFEFDLSGHPWIVGVLALAVLAYQGISFWLYIRVDRERRRIAEEGVRARLEGLRANVARAEVALGALSRVSSQEGMGAGETTKSWMQHASQEVSRQEREWAALRGRRDWDIWLPGAFVALSLAVFVWSRATSAPSTATPKALGASSATPSAAAGSARAPGGPAK